MSTTRREFLKAAALAPAILGAAADTPPNILFVICDQMRADALGALGGKNGRTPNLDRLAARGRSWLLITIVGQMPAGLKTASRCWIRFISQRGFQGINSSIGVKSKLKAP